MQSNSYKKIDKIDIEFLESLLGKYAISTKVEDLEKYDHDYTEDLHFLPEVVVIPETAEAVAQVLAYCNQKSIPVTVRGAGTGLSGGALPVFGGVVLSMEKLNRILEIDEENLQATVEPGVITQVFQE